MKIPNLARLPFGQLSRLIVGQINRGQYFFIVDGASAICGYCGWVQTTFENAEAWLENNVELSDAAMVDGPVCVVNIWQASTPQANAAIIGALRSRIHSATELIVAKRFYPDGTIRKVRLPIAKEQLRPGPSGSAGQSA